MRKTIQLIILGFIVFLSSCKLGPDFNRPEYFGPASFRFDSISTDTIVNLLWWEMFHDDVLDTLINHALENNKDVLIAATRVDAAAANLGYTKANQWPTFGFNVGASTGNSLGGIATLDEVSSNYFAFPQMDWEIGFWGKYRRLNESARAQLLASEYGLRTVQISLISAVASTYFTMLDNMAKLQISQRTLAARDSSEQIIQSRFNYGVVAEIDLNQAQIQTAISAAAVPTYKRAIALNQSTLSILLGQFPSSISFGKNLIDQLEPPDIPNGIPSQLLTRRPDVMQAEAEYAAQNARIGAAQAMRWPSLSLTGLFGIASSELSSLTSAGLGWSASGIVFGPLFNFGKNKRRVEIERANTETALRIYERVALQAFKEVEDALISIETFREELLAQRQRYQAAINAEYLSAERYDKGQTSYLEVLESQRQSFEAQLSYSQVRRDLLGAHVALYKALGGGWITEQEMNQASQSQP
jgi:multidrug efflux system outer membrane protein